MKKKKKDSIPSCFVDLIHYFFKLFHKKASGTYCRLKNTKITTYRLGEEVITNIVFCKDLFIFSNDVVNNHEFISLIA